MKKHMVALTVLMALSATAQADIDPTKLVTSTHQLTIKGSVKVDGCSFAAANDGGQELTLELGEKTVSWIAANQNVIAGSTEIDESTTLYCPSGITTVKLALEPTLASVEADNVILKNMDTGDKAATGLGFRLKAAFGDDGDLVGDPWVNFKTTNTKTATPDAKTGAIPVQFGANFVLTGTAYGVTEGTVTAQVPFKISYI